MLTIVKRICRQLDTIIQLLHKGTTKVHESVIESRVAQQQIVDDPSEMPELLDIQQVVDILNISTATYYRWVKQGELIPRRKGKRHYYYKGDLVQQLEEGRRRGRI